jgi:hypothetical protein
MASGSLSGEGGGVQFYKENTYQKGPPSARMEEHQLFGISRKRDIAAYEMQPTQELVSEVTEPAGLLSHAAREWTPGRQMRWRGLGRSVG